MMNVLISLRVVKHQSKFTLHLRKCFSDANGFWQYLQTKIVHLPLLSTWYVTRSSWSSSTACTFPSKVFGGEFCWTKKVNGFSTQIGACSFTLRTFTVTCITSHRVYRSAYTWQFMDQSPCLKLTIMPSSTSSKMKVMPHKTFNQLTGPEALWLIPMLSLLKIIKEFLVDIERDGEGAAVA